MFRPVLNLRRLKTSVVWNKSQLMERSEAAVKRTSVFLLKIQLLTCSPAATRDRCVELYLFSWKGLTEAINCSENLFKGGEFVLAQMTLEFFNHNWKVCVSEGHSLLYIYCVFCGPERLDATMITGFSLILWTADLSLRWKRCWSVFIHL